VSRLSEVEDYDILSYDSLTKKREGNEFYVKPGAKGDEALKQSGLWRRAGKAGTAGAKADMPPRKFRKKAVEPIPTDRERQEVLGRWLQAGAPTEGFGPAKNKEEGKRPAGERSGGAGHEPTGGAATEGKDELLALEARRVLKRNCYGCHFYEDKAGAPGDERDEYSVLRHEHVLGKLKPRSPQASVLWRMVDSGRMPKGRPRLGSADLFTLRRWIEQGAPSWPTGQRGPEVGPRAAVEAVRDHLRQANPADRKHLRYFTLINLFNQDVADVTDQDLRSARVALSKLLNSLSWQPDVTPPRALPGTGEAVLVIDLRKLGWEPLLWDAVLRHYPYGLRHGPVSAEVEKLSGCPQPYVQADWFVATASKPPLYHLLLGLPSNVRTLEQRLGVDPLDRVNYGDIYKDPQLLAMLRRPLLLRIFCDLGESWDESRKPIHELLEIRHPAELIGAFIEQASSDPDLTGEQSRLANYRWNDSSLAERALELTRKGGSEMSIEDLRRCLTPIDPTRTANDRDTLTDDEVLEGVHKCPFLERASNNRVHFAHRIFFEYFTALGMAEQLNNAANRFIAFDEIVLNVDMRKLLKGIVSTDEPEQEWGSLWGKRTKRSYGLEDLDEWKQDPDHPWDFQELDRNRLILLDSMTDPEAPPKETRDTIRWFLDIQNRWLHPRYLVYNYEAVAVYLWYNREADQNMELNGLFDKILKHRFKSVLKLLKKEGANLGVLRSPYELLVERVLDIGQRLRYAWSKRAAEPDRRRALLSRRVITDDNTRSRIKGILQNIRRSPY
jgi:hypothetical protein